MLTKNINGQAIAYKYNAGNQLIEEATNGNTIGYKHNANGDLTEKTSGEKYTYDVHGNLTALNGNGVDKEYTYNGAGNRLSESTNGVATYYVNDINTAYEQVLQSYDADGNTINTYTYGVQRINSKGLTNETFLYDGRGSIVGSVDSDNKVVTYAYTAYGDLMPSSLEPQVFGFNAEATDFTTGIQYLRARNYDATIARFFQEDDYRGEFRNPISMNRYIYTHNNPVMGIDPSGYNPRSTMAMIDGGKIWSKKKTVKPPVVRAGSTPMVLIDGEYLPTGNKTYQKYEYKSPYKPKVRNPFGYGPAWISEEVFNCLKDIEDGKSSEVDLYPVIDELDVVYEALGDKLIEYKGYLPYDMTILVGNIAELLSQPDAINFYSNKEDAAKEFSSNAMPMTDATNREHAAVMYGINGVYYNSDIYEGVHNTVWKFAVQNSYHPTGREEYLLHTHPNCECHINNEFSGKPGSLEPGDAFVVDILGYDGIYLASPNGFIYLYEGTSDNSDLTDNYANNVTELEALLPVAVGTPAKNKYDSSGKLIP